MPEQNAVIDIPLSQIKPGRNHRKVFDFKKLAELADSIAENGLAQPITVRPIPPTLDGKEYEIVAGERRFRAFHLHHISRDAIPCIIRELTYQQARDIMLVENTGRVDLNPIEEADAYHEHMEEFDYSEEQVAKVAGKSVGLVKRRLSLRKLVDEVKQMVATGHFPIGHAEAITDLDHNRQRIAVRIFRQSKNGLPLVAFRSIVAQLMEEQCQESLFDLESFWLTQVAEIADLPRRGKRAVTGAPTRPDLPPVHIQPRDNQGVIIDRYIAVLIESGHNAEAAAIGNLYDAMVKTNYLSVPAGAKLLAKTEA